MAGYTKTPLIAKVGVKENMKIAILGAPLGFKAELLGHAKVNYAEHGRDFDVVMYFSNSLSKLRAKIRTLRRMMKENGALWICWPKKGAKLLGDFSENDIRRLALSLQLVDVKVIAINETWSGLKLVIPVALREPPRA